MKEPYRLKPVVVLLDVYRRGVVAMGEALAVAGPALTAVIGRAADNLIVVARRIARPQGEMMPSLICQRIKAAKAR